MTSEVSAPPSAAAAAVPPRTLERLYAASGAAQWNVTLTAFAAVIAASVSHRFGSAAPDSDRIETFVRTLHLEDLALACACQEGNEAAWEHFILELRPALHAAARAIAGKNARELADGILAELFGVNEKGEPRRSLLAYYHGRARLTGWLRTVLAQRHVDTLRVAARTTAIDEESETAPALQTTASPADPHYGEYIQRAQNALNAAIGQLAPRDRLRLRMYYGEQLAMAQIGRALGEHEATVSRRLDGARRQLRKSIEATLRRQHGMSDEVIRECMRAAAESPQLHMSLVLEEESKGNA